MERITGTAHAPYVVRYVTDRRAVDFRYNLATDRWDAHEFDRSVDSVGRFVMIHETSMRRFDAAEAERIATTIIADGAFS